MAARTKLQSEGKRRKHSFTVTEARAKLDEVLALAFTSSDPVIIRQGKRFVVLKPMNAPNPVEVIPPHSYTIDDAWAAQMNSHHSDEFVPAPRRIRIKSKSGR